MRTDVKTSFNTHHANGSHHGGHHRFNGSKAGDDGLVPHERE